MSSLFSSLSPLALILLVLCSSSSAVLASIPQSFQHTNLLRTVDLTKPYIRESTALILENISNSTQTEYYWGIPLDIVPKLSYLEVKEKRTDATELFSIEPALEDHSYLYYCHVLTCSILQVYKIDIPELHPGEKISLVISSAYVDSLTPYPAIVEQDERQYLLYSGEKYTPTLYTTLKQKTKLKYSHTSFIVDIDLTGRLNRILREKQISTDNLILQNQAWF